MKRYCVVLILALIALVVPAHAQSLDDQYFAIFSLIQEADSLKGSEPAKALGKFLQAQAALQQFKSGNPDWNPQVVNFRITYVAEQLAALSSVAPSQAQPGSSGTNRPAPRTSLPDAAVTNAPGDLQWQINALKEQVKQMLADRGMLEAKLKEALAARPAESDPRELARAEEKVATLQKENDLLKASLEAQKAKTTTADPKVVEQLQSALADLNKQLAQQKEAALKLATEKEALQARVRSTPDLASLQAENDLLKKQILSASTNALVSPAQTDQSRDAAVQLAALKSEKELLLKENRTLLEKLKQPPSPSINADQAARLRELERERDDLQKKLARATKASGAGKGKAGSNVRDLEIQLSSALARVEVLEARQVPYSAEELALLRQPPAGPKTENLENKPKTSQLPPNAAKRMKEAQSFYASKQFDKAEEAYMELLKEDPSNVVCLANLAAIQSEAGKLDAAEKNLTLALTENPEDVFSLQTFGLTKFRQAKYDDSLNALSRAAKLDPQNAEIQNYLGLVLSEKGMRGPAESAFRKAIQLQPDYAQAHYNLAVSYAMQKPPAVELGKFHYQKALSLGQARNAELEKRFESR